MPTPEKHALLSASSAERWLNCTPSARLAEDMPDKSTQYTEAGRLAHAIAELKLRKQYLEAMGPRKFTTALNKLKADHTSRPRCCPPRTNIWTSSTKLSSHSPRGRT